MSLRPGAEEWAPPAASGTAAPAADAGLAVPDPAALALILAEHDRSAPAVLAAALSAGGFHDIAAMVLDGAARGGAGNVGSGGGDVGVAGGGTGGADGEDESNLAEIEAAMQAAEVRYCCPARARARAARALPERTHSSRANHLPRMHPFTAFTLAHRSRPSSTSAASRARSARCSRCR